MELTYNTQSSSILQEAPAVAEDGGHEVGYNQDSYDEDPKGERVSTVIL